MYCLTERYSKNQHLIDITLEPIRTH